MKKKFIQKLSCLALGALLFSSMLIGCGAKKNTPSTEESPTTSSMEVNETETSTLSLTSSSKNAMEIMNEITVGWNLGNSFDSCVDSDKRNTDGSITPDFYETAWGNPVVSFELIDSVKAAGFNTIRIPVTWYYNTYEDNSGTLHVQKAWMERVKEVVDYCISEDLYVVLDSHHDGEFIYADSDSIDDVKKNVSCLWSEIAYEFIDYDYHLLFEGFNELNDKAVTWKIYEEYLQNCNELNQLFVDTIRATGGNNATRVLVVGTYLNGHSEDILKGFVLPTDSASQSLIVSVHFYTNTFDQEIENSFASIETFSSKISAPVLITEFGTTHGFTPVELRGTHAANYIARAKGHKLKCIWWDDGSKYALFDRSNNSIKEASIIEGLMNPVTNTVVYSKDLKISSIDQFIYQTIDPETGFLVDSTSGALTYIDEGIGLSVLSGKQYMISLSIADSGDGMRISQVAFYDENSQFLQTNELDSVTSVNLSAPENAAFMRIVLYNPWGVRSYMEYESMLSSKDLILNIKEFTLN